MSRSVDPTERTTASFAEALTAIVRTRQIGVRQLARAVGASPSHVSRLLRASEGKQPSLDLVQRVTEVLELPTEYFLETRRAGLVAELARRPGLVDEWYGSRSLAKPR